MFPPPPPKRPPVHPPPLSAAASISPNTPQPLPPSAAPRTPFRTHPYQYPYAFPSLHRDPADRPHASPAAEARTGNDHTLTNNALYHLLLSGHPPHADAPSPSSSSSSEDADSGYRECRVPYRGEAPVPDTEADAEKDTPTDARVGGILINPLQPQASQVPEEKKKKSVSFAKTVNVRHYPENSYPDVRKFEEERRSRRRKKKKRKLGLGLSAVGEEGNEEGEDGKDSEEVLKRSEEEEKGEEGEGEGKEECCETAAVVLQKEEVEVEEKKENAPKGWKKRSLEGIRGAALNFFRRLK